MLYKSWSNTSSGYEKPDSQKYSFVEKLKGGGVKGRSPSKEYILLHNAFSQLAKCLKNIFTHYKTLGWQ